MAHKINRLFGLCLTLAGAVSTNFVLELQFPTSALADVTIGVQAFAEHFSSIRSMSGDFVQSGPRGEQTSGQFFLKRPGKIRFNYAKQTGITVISDGNSLVIVNKRLKTSRLYPLSKTPLGLLLANNVDFSGGRLKAVKQDGDLVTVQLADKSAFGNSRISMIFDRKSLELRRWTIIDERGLATTVAITNVKQDAHFAEGIFKIDYAANREVNTSTKSR